MVVLIGVVGGCLEMGWVVECVKLLVGFVKVVGFVVMVVGFVKVVGLFEDV